MWYSRVDSPVGELTLLGDGDALTGLYFPRHRHWGGLPDGCVRDDGSARVFRHQLDEYFEGRRRCFETTLRPEGTRFQHRVWDELRCIPYGVTVTYAQLAERIGMRGAARAVGAANGRNPISIIVPCHRVIGANGALTGYGGGEGAKATLLRLERRFGAATS